MKQRKPTVREIKLLTSSRWQLTEAEWTERTAVRMRIRNRHSYDVEQGVEPAKSFAEIKEHLRRGLPIEQICDPEEEEAVEAETLEEEPADDVPHLDDEPADNILPPDAFELDPVDESDDEMEEVEEVEEDDVEEVTQTRNGIGGMAPLLAICLGIPVVETLARWCTQGLTGGSGIVDDAKKNEPPGSSSGYHSGNTGPITFQEPARPLSTSLDDYGLQLS